MFFMKNKDSTVSQKAECCTKAHVMPSSTDNAAKAPQKATDQVPNKFFGLDPVTLARAQLFKLLRGGR
jgi:hypothetical protein